MRIFYIHQYFKTPEEGGGVRSYYLAKAMADAGHHVDLFTAHNRDTYKKAFVDGIHVHYLPVKYDQSFGFFRRVRAFLVFVLLIMIKTDSLPKADLCYVSSTPLTTGLAAIYLKWRYKIPYYFEVRDLWPEAPVQLKVIRNKALKRLLYWLEKNIYQKAKAIVALSPGAQRYISERVPQKEVLLLPNMADCDFFEKTEKNPYHELQFRVNGKFVVTYFGAVGKVNQLQNLLDAAEACQQKLLHEVAFMIAGEGSELPAIQQEAEARGLKNLHFVPFQNKYGLLSVLNVTDAVYISFMDLPVLQHCSPNKLFDALAAGKLCISTLPGWMQEMLEDNQCGFYADPSRPEEFVKSIAPFVNDRELLESFQSNARKLAERSFSRKAQAEKLLAFIEGRQEPVTKAYTLPV